MLGEPPLCSLDFFVILYTSTCSLIRTMCRSVAFVPVSCVDSMIVSLYFRFFKICLQLSELSGNQTLLKIQGLQG